MFVFVAVGSAFCEHTEYYGAMTKVSSDIRWSKSDSCNPLYAVVLQVQ